MEINIRKPFKSIRPFMLKDLPDLVVLTGENGTGKTQLLEYLYYGSRSDENGVIMIPDDDSISQLPSIDMIEDGNGEMHVEYPCEIVSNGERLTNVVYRPIQTPSVDLGGGYNLNTLYKKGQNIAQKHLFYKTQLQNKALDGMGPKELTSSFNNILGIKKSSRISDATFPEITSDDINIIKRIETEFPIFEPEKDPFYYVAFQQPPKGEVFSANLKFLYFQYWARIKAGMAVGESPWDTFNKIGNILNFKYELDEPKINEEKFDVRLRDKDRKIFISPNALSSGEKVIFSLFVAMFTTHSQEQLPSLILFDEPDAYLHPSLSSTMLKVIRDVFIGEHKIKVIMTTHSPTTVAILPETSLYSMKDGKMKKVTKQEAILALTSGLNTISVYYENVKQVFVEADNDNLFMTHVYHHAMTLGKLIKDINLKFVNVGDDKQGGCTTVRKVVNDLAGADNKTVFGIIDYDGKNGPSDRIKILGNGSRYSIDNYLVDPLVVSLLYLEEPNERKKVGFEEHDSIVGYSKKTQAERQSYANSVISILELIVPEVEKMDKDLINYQTLDGNEYSIPRWYTIIPGHRLVYYIRQAARFLNKYNDKILYKHIITTIYENHPEIIPMDVVDTLRSIQES